MGDDVANIYFDRKLVFGLIINATSAYAAEVNELMTREDDIDDIGFHIWDNYDFEIIMLYQKMRLI